MYKFFFCSALSLCLLAACAEQSADSAARPQPMDSAFHSIHEL